MSSVNYTGQRVEAFIITGFDHIPHQKLLGFLVLLTYFLILLGNSSNICVIVTDRRLHRPMYILICNLAVVDIMYTTGACTTMISVLLAGVKSISYYSCISNMCTFHLGSIMVSLTLAIMALDHLIAISRPLRYGTILTNARVFTLILIIWVINCSVMGALTSILDNLLYCQPVIRYVFCDAPAMARAACHFNPVPFFNMAAALMLILFMLVFFFILFSYVQIVYTVMKLANISNRSQMFNTCISHIIVVISFYAPKFVSGLLTRVGVRLNLTERNAILIVSTLVSSLINPTVYCLKTKEIRTRLVQILKNIEVHCYSNK